MSLFRCPLCAAPLTRASGAYRCPGGHSFDVAKEGYVHLLPPNRKHSALPGDDRDMVLARRDFLSRGYYQPLLDALCGRILALPGESPALLDAGCGEGYYTAARRERDAEFAVASSYRLPLADGSVDALLNCFSPLALEEFRRVLKPGGAFLYVVPGPDHLWEMKEILYDRPYPNEEKETPYEGFRYREIVPVDGTIALQDREDIWNLFRMTPYFWKTPRAGAERLAALDRLELRTSFRVHAFEKL